MSNNVYGITANLDILPNWSHDVRVCVCVCITCCHHNISKDEKYGLGEKEEIRVRSPNIPRNSSRIGELDQWTSFHLPYITIVLYEGTI